MAGSFKTMMRTPAARLFLIAGMLVVLQIPVLMVGSLVEERQSRQDEVEREFGRGWGPAQTIWGPAVAVPYRWIEPPLKAGDNPVLHRGWVQAAPGKTDATVALTTERRRRGMFEATVYSADVALSGTLAIPNLPASDARRPEMLWSEAVVMLGITRSRGMGSDAAVTVDGVARPFAPMPGESCSVQYLAAPLPLQGPGRATPAYSTRFTLHGTNAIQLAPEARQGSVTMKADWPTPSFLEGMMPARYTTGADGFTADWDVPGSPGAGASIDRGEMNPGCRGDFTAGVALQQAVPTYQMVVRSMKYESLFLVLAFLTYFLFETMSGVRIHVMQYGLLGLSVTLFPLILVSVAEPVGFAIGYAVATAAVLVQATLYTLSVTRRARLAATFGAVLAGLFGFLYVVLNLDSYALLAGTAALFAVLSVVMAATRRIDWTRTRAESEELA